MNQISFLALPYVIILILSESSVGIESLIIAAATFEREYRYGIFIQYHLLLWFVWFYYQE